MSFRGGTTSYFILLGEKLVHRVATSKLYVGKGKVGADKSP
jgi:hypothetical protein